MPFNIRKPFVRRTTDHPVIEENVADNVNQVDADGKSVPHTDNSGHDNGAISSSVDQLKKFKKTHQWDYNLDYDTIVRCAILLYEWAMARQCRLQLLVGGGVNQKSTTAEASTMKGLRTLFAAPSMANAFQTSRERA